MNGTRIVLVQCTNSKRDERAPARDLYDESDYFRDYRAYALEKGDEWYILSAKHGLLDPETVIDPYDERGLNEAQAESIAEYFADRTRGDDIIEVLAGGRDYADVLTPELERQTAADVLEPHRGLRIGERRQKAQQAVAEVDG